jgi:cyclin-dependent kinase
LKKIRLQAEEEGIPSTAIREISLLKELQDVNIVRLLDVIHTEKKLTLVFEYLDQDLKKLIDGGGGDGLDKLTYKSYLYQLLKGVAYIHKFKILHRDLKPQNLLISREGILKIADFGLARGYGIPVKNYTHEVVTLWYRPPDVLLGSRNYLTTVDIWSVGCIFAEMVNGKPLFTGSSEADQLKRIFKIRGTPTEKVWPDISKLSEWNPESYETYKEEPLEKYCGKLDKDGLDLIEKMLQMDPEKRISAEDALKHPFFNDVLASVKELYKKNK